MRARQARKATITVATKGRPAHLAAMLTSLLFHVPHVDTILVGLNGRNSWNSLCDQVAAALLELGLRCEVVDLSTKSYSQTHAELVERSTSDVLFRVDDDHLIAPGCMKELLAVFDDCRVGVAAPLVLHPGRITHISRAQMSQLRSEARKTVVLNTSLQLGMHPTKSPIRVPDVYSTFMMRKSAVIQAGGIATCYRCCGYREETDLTLRIALNGDIVLIVPSAVVWHLRAGRGGERCNHAEWQRRLKANERIFARRLLRWQNDLRTLADEIWGREPA